MKIKRIVDLLLFWGVFCVMLAMISYVITPKSKDVYDVKGTSNKINDLSTEKENSIDVLFVGDSLTYSSFCPLLMYKSSGITSYVLGTSGQKICDTKYLLEEAIKKQAPKVVFIETGVLFRSNGGTSGKSEDFVQDYLEKNIYAVKYHGRCTAFLLEYVNRKNNKNDEAMLKGYRYRTRTESYVGGEYMIATTAKRKFAVSATKYMDEIISLCNKYGISLVLVSIPSAQNWDMSKHNSVVQYANEKNLSYVDMNMLELGIDWKKDTRDKGDHLNFYGACKTTKYIEKYIKSEYVLLDHRSEKDFDNWNTMSNDFYKKYVANDIKAEYLIE